MKITDAHTHNLYNNGDINSIAEVFKEIKEHFDLENFHFLSIPHHGEEDDLTQNLKCLYLKDRFSSYASASLEHSFDKNDTREKFGKQAEFYHKLGFDGYKMLEGKPGLRKKSGFALNAPVYWDFYEYAESHGLPIVMHAADPEKYWDLSQATEYQIQQGWIYDESYPSKEDIRKEVWGIMENFPKLKLTLAHFGFLYFDRRFAAEFLEKWENTCFDLVVGDPLMTRVREDFPWWSSFFEENKTRFIFGTDLYPFERKDKSYDEILPRVERIKGYIEEIGNDLIYYENHKKRYGEPKKIDKELLFKSMDETLLNEKITEAQKKDMEIIKEYFKKYDLVGKD